MSSWTEKTVVAAQKVVIRIAFVSNELANFFWSAFANFGPYDYDQTKWLTLRKFFLLWWRSFFKELISLYEIDIGPSHLIGHPSKTPFRAPFKNHFFGTRYPYPRSGALTIMTARIRVSLIWWHMKNYNFFKTTSTLE